LINKGRFMINTRTFTQAFVLSAGILISSLNANTPQKETTNTPAQQESISLLNANTPQKENTKTFTQQELQDAIAKELAKAGVKQNSGIDSAIAKTLSKYEISGMAFTIDPNFGFIYDCQNPSFIFKYKNNLGETKFRQYSSSIESIGIKLSFSINFNFAFIAGGDVNYENSNQTLILGNGLELSLLSNFIPAPLPGLTLTIVSIVNIPGAYLIMFTVNPPFLRHSACSYIFGGHLTPQA
jgi:hypothetical protein